ncbi:ANTAR domain-containing protein [Arthrobacter sp. SLBN-100]|uniref:ANTAR domain-containing protein n=1 Tax=Arthrobacter sp. SLBN-100 TaxID=2768450 RepID=UPI00115488B2|nr:ANTAR domain-containing protein [Arthrobacter sp. SLBN-100]TQJ69061.1 ANTAR domain-containing protein [Arthrobacter sp. SLBN-100]
MHAQYANSDFPGRRARALSGAGDEEAFETKASPPAVAGPLTSQQGPLHHPHGPATHGSPPRGRAPQANATPGTAAAGNTAPGTAASGNARQPAASGSHNGKPSGILLDLVTGAETLLDSLELLAAASARAVVGTPGLVIECGVVVRQAKRAPVITGTSEEVIRLLQWEQEKGEGPVSDVLAGGHPVAVLQRTGDFRWPRYCRELQAANLGSVLGMRLRLDQDNGTLSDDAIPVRETTAALAFFAQDAKAFPLQVISEARSFAGLAAKSLQMALDLHNAKSAALDLRLALDSRTSINVACGVIMAQNRCSYHEAFSILARASSHRNIKVRLVAEDILERLPEGPPRAHFGH